MPKAEAAARRLRSVNAAVQVEAVPRDVHSGTVRESLTDVDAIVDGTDNLETRFLLNEAAMDLGILLIYGGAIATYGMVRTIRAPETGGCACFNSDWPR